MKGVKILILLEFVGEPQSLSKVVRKIAAVNRSPFVHYLNNERMISFLSLTSIKRGQSTVVYKEDKKGVTPSLVFSSGDLEGRI